MGLIVCMAVGLMVLKSATWMAVVRLHASPVLNVLYVLSTGLMIWSYVLAVFRDPGAPMLAVDQRVGAAERGETEDDVGDTGREDEAALHGDASGARYCERCDAPKPPHVHHCSQCRRCVYRMDHHCPWTNNCVGWTNKKYFLLFLVYTATSCLLFNAMTAPLVWGEAPASVAVRRAHEELLELTWALSLMVGTILTGYAGFHVWLLGQGKTTLEYLAGRPGEFEGLPWGRHAQIYFGRDRCWWWLPVAPGLALDPRRRRRPYTPRGALVL